MASIQPGARHYGAAHLKQLMDSMDGQASNWDDVLDYLENPSRARAGIADDELPELIEDVRHLKDDNVHFTTDYREMWKELTGESVDELSEPETRNASSRVLDVLRRVESKEYRDMAAQLDLSSDWLRRRH